MERGVRVLAAAPGTVVATRDGLPDVNVKLIGADIVRDQGLGNAVVLDHGNGWRSYYGHMRRGSIALKPGDRVKAGPVRKAAVGERGGQEGVKPGGAGSI